MKRMKEIEIKLDGHQPPSGGCVLKQELAEKVEKLENPAAFGRLCVETSSLAAALAIFRTSRLRAAVC